MQCADTLEKRARLMLEQLKSKRRKRKKRNKKLPKVSSSRSSRPWKAGHFLHVPFVSVSIVP